MKRKENIVRNNRAILIIGIVFIITFIIAVLFFGLNGVIMGVLFSSAFIVLGLLFIIIYEKEYLSIGENTLEHYHWIKKTQKVYYEDIHCLLIVPLESVTDLIIIDKNYNSVIRLDMNLQNIERIFRVFEEKDIPILDLSEIVERKEDTSKFLNALNTLEKNYYLKIQKEIENSESILAENIMSDDKKK